VVRLCLPMVWGAASRVRVDAVDDPFAKLAPMQEQIDAQNVLDDLLKVKEYADKGADYSIVLVAPQATRGVCGDRCGGCGPGGQIWSDPPFVHVVTDMDGVTQLSGDTGVPSEDLKGISQVALHGSYPNYSNEENKTPSGSLTDITRVACLPRVGPVASLAAFRAMHRCRGLPCSQELARDAKTRAPCSAQLAGRPAWRDSTLTMHVRSHKFHGLH